MITFSKLGQMGRLGNQLFQIASTMGIAADNNLHYAFPKWKYSPYFRYDIYDKIGSIEGFKQFRQTGCSFKPVTVDDHTDLIGYFQSEKWFYNHEEMIRRTFSMSPNYVNELMGAVNKCKAFVPGRNTCAIHVRRGDYLNHPTHFPPLPLNYYQEAMKKFDNTNFIVFSDEIEWCKKAFVEDLKVKPHKLFFSEGNKDIIDMFLMAQCDHAIIANSSFSWWGAWLNTNPQKRIIAPTLWFGPENGFFGDDIDIVPATWERINIPVSI